MKVPLDLEVALARIEQALRTYPKAALFDLAERGYRSPFEQMLACMLSIRTRDETTLVVAESLFAQARTPADLAALPLAELDTLIHASSFHENKARQMHAIARRALEEWDGVLPCDRDALLSLPGVGPKCANLVLGIACGQPFIGVDVHVHRVTNRWGCVASGTPERTLIALEAVVPVEHWLDINRLLMPFGKFICTGRLPYCSSCPVLEMCQQVGVEAHR